MRSVSIGSSQSDRLLPKSRHTPTHSLPRRFSHAACSAARHPLWFSMPSFIWCFFSRGSIAATCFWLFSNICFHGPTASKSS